MEAKSKEPCSTATRILDKLIRIGLGSTVGCSQIWQNVQKNV